MRHLSLGTTCEKSWSGPLWVRPWCFLKDLTLIAAIAVAVNKPVPIKHRIKSPQIASCFRTASAIATAIS